MRWVASFGADDHRDDIRGGQHRLRLAFAERAQCARQLVAEQVRDPCPGPPVAGDVDRPAAFRGDQLGEPGRQRLLRPVDADSGRGRVAEHDHPQRRAGSAVLADHAVDIEARVRGEKLQASEADHLDGDEAQEAAEQPSEDARGCVEPA